MLVAFSVHANNSDTSLSQDHFTANSGQLTVKQKIDRSKQLFKEQRQKLIELAKQKQRAEAKVKIENRAKRLTTSLQ